MTNQEKFQQLQKQYTIEELADAVMVPEELSEAELAKANEEFRSLRLQMLANQTEEKRLFAEVMRLRFQIEEVIKQSLFFPDKSFAAFLAEYIAIFRRNKKQFAEDLDVHYTRLSRILNERDEPNVELAYRLEKHSGGLIKAELWWRLSIVKQEYFIKQDAVGRNREGAKVRNGLRVELGESRA